METDRNKEELLHSLPDYAAGSITDEVLKQRIEDELKCNADFRDELELIKDTFTFLNEHSFSEPPAHYFTNLIPQIRSRIDSSSKPQRSGIFRFAYFYKYALPALSVIVLILIITISNKNSNDSSVFVKTEDTINRIMSSSKDTVNTTSVTKEADVPEEKLLADDTKEYTPPKSVREKTSKQQMKAVSEKSNGSNINIDALLYETETTYQYDDYVYEADFGKLTGKEQSELINKLSNTKF